MNFSDDDRLQLNELCGALVDDTIDTAQRKRLAEMLATSEEARRFYVRAMSLSASLHAFKQRQGHSDFDINFYISFVFQFIFDL